MNIHDSQSLFSSGPVRNGVGGEFRGGAKAGQCDNHTDKMTQHKKMLKKRTYSSVLFVG